MPDTVRANPFAALEELHRANCAELARRRAGMHKGRCSRLVPRATSRVPSGAFELCSCRADWQLCTSHSQSCHRTLAKGARRLHHVGKHPKNCPAAESSVCCGLSHAQLTMRVLCAAERPQQRYAQPPYARPPACTMSGRAARLPPFHR
jgi:hypothetical protein